MAKLQLKSDTINPFGGLFAIFKQFERSGVRAVDQLLGKCGSTKAAYSHGDVFATLFGNYLCVGDVIEDVMDIKPFWNGREDIRVCSYDVILRTLRKFVDGLTKDCFLHATANAVTYAANFVELKVRARCFLWIICSRSAILEQAQIALAQSQISRSRHGTPR